MISWRALEENTKSLAGYIWDCDARPETLNGVKFDCVLRPKADHYVLVEITENQNLDKVRTDIIKLGSCRMTLIAEGIYTQCFIVMRDEPTESMKVTGVGNKVQVMSYESFSSYFMAYESYANVREKSTFGSSVNPISGEPDPINYTPVHYINSTTKKEVKLKDISRFLVNKKRIILLGSYGTGKSRCIRELFKSLAIRNNHNLQYPIAINLKDNWGTKRAEEIIRRHVEDLGLSSMGDSILKVLRNDRFILLLDGFDEIGAQGWSDSATRLIQIRASALSAVKDLITKTEGAVIITGREHYFNSHKEMFEALGLRSQDTIIIECKDEFSENEMKTYLKGLSSSLTLTCLASKTTINMSDN